MKTKLLFLLLLSLTTMAQTNLVSNGNFETWTSSSQPDNWYGFLSGYISQSTTAQNGSSSTNMMVATGTFTFINSDYFAVQANKTYRVTLYHKTVSGTFSSIDFSLYHKPGTFKEEIIKKSDVTFSTTEWRKVEFEYTSTVNENIEVDVYTYGSLDSEILVDNISVVDINEAPAQYTKIPDANFEKKLIDLGIDSGAIDGQVLTSKINAVTNINVDDSSITDLTGIEDFASIRTLDCNNNNLTSLNLSKNLSLVNISCRDNQLTSIIFNKEIAIIDASGNKLETVDLSQNTSLHFLNLTANLLTSIDLSQNANLTSLQIGSNKITELNLSKNKALNYLRCSSNQLAAIDVSNNTSLEILYIPFNQLTTLDLSKNTKLTYVDCSFNKLVSLNVDNAVALENLACKYNKLTNLNLSDNIGLTKLESESNLLESINVLTSVNLAYFNCSYNQLKTLDVSKNGALTYFNCSGNKLLSELNLKNGNNTKIKSTDLSIGSSPSLYCLMVDDVAYANTNWSENIDAYTTFTDAPCAPAQYTAIPDPGFEKTLIAMGIDFVEDGKVFTSRISNIKELNLSGYDYNITDLTGISAFTALESLKMPYNGLSDITTLDVSKNLMLKKLDCSQSLLTTLDVSKNLALVELNFSYNKLKTIDVSKNLSLETLNCSYNRLTTIDVSKNLALKNLYSVGANSEGDGNLEKGLLTSIDVSKNTELNFLDISYNPGIAGLDITKNTKLTGLNISNNSLLKTDYPENKLLKTLACEYLNLTTLDISNYPDLEILRCGSNALKTLDVTKHLALKRLSIEGNQISVLDVSNNTQLISLYASSNKLTTLDLSKNPNLEQVLCNNNNLMKLNFKNGANTKIDSYYQTTFTDNPNLTCILVDDVNYADTKWANYKDKSASYNAAECNFSLGPKNFTVESKGETCIGENNGEISITAIAALQYAVTVNGIAKTFTNNTLKLSSLAPGTYTIIISVSNETYEQSFSVTIPKAASITGKSTVTSKKVDVEITEGTAPYTVFVDGEAQFQTIDNNFSVALEKGGLVEVATSKACEGIFAKKVSSSELGTILAAYPNPTSGAVEIAIPSTKAEAVIEIYNFGGQLVSHDTYKIENRTAKLNLQNLPSGIYAAKIYLETPEYVKIIKK